MKKIAIFVDGSNHGRAMKAAGFRVDYTKLREYFSGYGSVVGSYYFTALPPKGEPSPIRNLTDSLSYRGWTIVTKEMKRWVNDGVEKVKGNMDIEMVVKIIRMAHMETITDAILLSGDSDFADMVQYVQELGVRVTVISHRDVAGDELQRGVFEYIEIAQLRKEIELPMKDIKQRRRDFLEGS